MTPERWSRISDLFDAALELEEPERSAWLDRAGIDPEDRAEVLSLLVHAGGMTQTGPLAAVRAVAGEALGTLSPDGWVNRQLGAWRLTRVIGQGGMGVVFAAEHATLGKMAAIKLVRRTFGDPLAEARFLRERKILSRLEHPNIARILDGGTQDGMPYFVMELIDGHPLLEWCETHNLSIEARLRLFVELCGAVHYAHRNLVVHRDLKPSNVMVTRDGVPRLLDFGIARSLESDEADALTGTAGQLMTPEYASPEQIRSEPISTATDVYALGAVLFELLTGERAQPVTSLADAIRVICEQPTPPPSSVVRDPARARAIRGDLDTIVAMAMRKEPERRYPTAGELGEDVHRFLARLPVRAQRDTAGYRLRRFLARNRVAAALAAVALVFLVGGVIGTWRMAEARAVEAARARQRLEEIRQLANRFLFEFDEAIAPIAGTTPAREMIVRTAQEYLAGLVADAEADPVLADELATAYEKLGSIQGLPTTFNLGQVAQGILSFEKALALRRKACEQRPDDDDARRALLLNYVSLSSLRSEGADPKNAEADARMAVTLSGQLKGTEAPDLHARGEAHRALAEILREGSDMTLAVKEYEQAIHLHRAGLSARSSVDGEIHLASSLERIATALSWQGEFEASARALLECRALREAALARNPDDAGARRRVLVAVQLLAHLYYHPELPSLGDQANGRKNAERMLELAEALVARDPANAATIGDLARALYVSAATYMEQEPERALRAFDRALSLIPRMGTGTDALYGRVFLLRLSVVPLRTLERLDEAVSRLELAQAGLDELTRLTGQQSSFLTALITAESAMVAAARRESDRARRLFDEAIQLEQSMVADSPTRLDFHSLLSLSLERAAELALASGESERACKLRHERLELWRRWNQLNTRSPYSLRAERLAEAAAGMCSQAP